MMLWPAKFQPTEHAKEILDLAITWICVSRNSEKTNLTMHVKVSPDLGIAPALHSSSFTCSSPEQDLTDKKSWGDVCLWWNQLHDSLLFSFGKTHRTKGCGEEGQLGQGCILCPKCYSWLQKHLTALLAIVSRNIRYKWTMFSIMSEILRFIIR